MKAITLIQPRATLLAIGAVPLDVRLEGTAYRGRIAIHAAWSWPGFFRDLTEAEPVWSALRAEHYHHRNLPRGAVVAVAELAEVTLYHPDVDPGPANVLERYVHDWAPGRYIWTLRNVIRLRPIGARGRPGLWDWPEPEWLEDRLREPREAVGP